MRIVANTAMGCAEPHRFFFMPTKSKSRCAEAHPMKTFGNPAG
jgi:hypothetical protein